MGFGWERLLMALHHLLQNKTNKNVYILLSGDLNARIGNAEVQNIVGNFGEPITNTNGLKLRGFATYNNMEIMNSFYKHKNIHT
jgi:hypothetical protein